MRASRNIINDIRDTNDRCIRLADRLERSGAVRLAEATVTDIATVALEFGSNPGMHVHQTLGTSQVDPICSGEDLPLFDSGSDEFNSRSAGQCYTHIKRALRNEEADVQLSESDVHDLTFIRMASRMIESRRKIPASRKFRR